MKNHMILSLLQDFEETIMKISQCAVFSLYRKNLYEGKVCDIMKESNTNSSTSQVNKKPQTPIN